MPEDLKLGQEIEIFSEDIMVYKATITKENIEKVEKYLKEGYGYYIKEN